jgi:hypothetical protein
MSSFGSAIAFPHFLHFTVSKGSYIGIKSSALLVCIEREQSLDIKAVLVKDEVRILNGRRD